MTSPFALLFLPLVALKTTPDTTVAPPAPPTLSATTTPPPVAPAPSRAGPTIIGLGLGYASAFGHSFGGYFLGSVAQGYFNATPTNTALAVVFGGLGAAAGVIAADAMFGLRGRGWPALVGSGIVSVGAMIHAQVSPSHYAAHSSFIWAAGAVLGALIASEVTAAVNPALPRPRARPTAYTLFPSVSALPEGGALLSISGTM